MNYLNGLLNLVEFVWEALKTYANTPEGQHHLTEVEAAFGIDVSNAETTQPLDISSVGAPGTSDTSRVVRP